MDDRARVSLSVHEGKLEVEGSEAFVQKQMELLADVVETLLAKPQAKPAQAHQPAPPSKVGSTPLPPSGPATAQAPAQAYPNVFAVDDTGRLQIIRTVSGDNKSAKTVSVALLQLLGSDLQGTRSLSFDAIRDVCKAQSCLDPSNFAATLKDEKRYFLCGGSGKSQTASLTLPGKSKAAALAVELNTAATT